MTVDTQALRKRLEERKSGWPFPSDRALVDHIPALLSEIERKDAEVARLRAQLEYTDRYAMDSIRTASRDLDDWHGDMLHLSNSARAALSPNPGDPTPTGVSE